jgi:hypothetical protein
MRRWVHTTAPSGLRATTRVSAKGHDRGVRQRMVAAGTSRSVELRAGAPPGAGRLAPWAGANAGDPMARRAAVGRQHLLRRAGKAPAQTPGQVGAAPMDET